LWLSETESFDPETVTPLIDEEASEIPTSTIVCLPLDSAGAHALYYWRVSIFDANGDGAFVNITAQQTIPAYPA
jgi:hypothetical protein